MLRRSETVSRCGQRGHNRQKDAANTFAESAQYGDAQHRNKRQDKRVFDQRLTLYMLNWAKASVAAIACMAHHSHYFGIFNKIP